MNLALAKRLAAAAIAALAPLAAQAQAYPTKPITLVVPFAAGGPTDVVARVLGAALKDPAVVAKLDEPGAVIVADAKLTPAGLQTWLQQETARYAPVIKAAGQFAD